MEVVLSAGVVLALIMICLGAGIWIFAALTLVGLAILLFWLGMPISQVGSILKGTMWKGANVWELASVPIFVWMGDIIFRTDISQRLFRGLEPWVDLLPGRLLHVNVAGSALFAAVCGSSAATTATIGRITIASLLERGYNRSLATGSLCGAGALGIMIPPSITMIIYGVLTDVSIARLFAAGVVPGILAAGLYSGYIMILASFNRSLVPPQAKRFSWVDRMNALVELTPVLILIAIVLGGIYTGIVTPSEAATLGLATTLVIVALLGQLSWRLLLETLEAAVSMTSMILTIVVAAAVISASLAYLHLPQDLAKLIGSMQISPYVLLFCLTVFYIFIGLFMEGVSIFVTTLPIAMPLVVQAGFDPVWFGVFLVIMVELGTVSPPVGFNLYILQSLTKQTMSQVSWAALPFALLLSLSGLLMTIFPSIALWLPSRLFD